MLFNSYIFIFAFLPATLFGCWALSRISRRAALGYVAAASLVFYGYWEPKYLALLVPSLLVNFVLGRLIARTRRKFWLIAGVAGNLAVIGWFKYSLFLYLTASGGATPPDFLRGIVLPLGISFITFQKIAYLVDVWRGHHDADKFDRFAFFVLFFPQLIAGPIVLYRYMEPQILRWPPSDRYLRGSLQLGLLFFALGLFKKVVLADSLAIYANDVFRFAALPSYDLDPRDAWIGALAYSLQLYFDFSGYSDMAVGLARMFGFKLPMNFNSPYKASGIVDFWRRWHMTLTAFFRNYVYIPLGGNRNGLAKQLWYIMVVFFLTGLWHGAGWTFIIWGSVHGVLVVINHLWARRFAPRVRRGVGSIPAVTRAGAVLSRALTLLAVVSLWVVFRAESWPVAEKILRAMFGISGMTYARAFPDSYQYYVAWSLLAALWTFVLVAPNSFEFARLARRWTSRPALRDPSNRRKAWIPAVVAGTALYFAVSGIGVVKSQFIYFNF